MSSIRNIITPKKGSKSPEESGKMIIYSIFAEKTF